MAMSKGFTRKRANEFYGIYEGQVKKQKISPDRINNLVETGITTVQSHGKVLAPKGRKRLVHATINDKALLMMDNGNSHVLLELL